MIALDPIYNIRPTDEMFVDCVATPLSEGQATYCLNLAWIKLFDSAPSINSLAILWSQSCLETGRWKLLRNHNWGNIKKVSGEKYTSYFCSEVLNGINVNFYSYNPQTFFGSWDSALDGAVFYINFVANRPRYKKAWVALQEGNPTKYVTELKNGGYFTAPLNSYLATVMKLYNEFLSRKEELLAWQPPIVLEPVPEPKQDPPAPPPETPPITPINTQPDFFSAIIKFLMQLLGNKG